MTEAGQSAWEAIGVLQDEVLGDALLLMSPTIIVTQHSAMTQSVDRYMVHRFQDLLVGCPLAALCEAVDGDVRELFAGCHWPC